MLVRYRLRLLLGFAYACCLAGPPVRANENTIEYDTSVAGQLVPKEETEIQVRGEDLEIRFEEVNDYGFFQEQSHYKPVRVHVTARYRLFNPGATREPLIAFPILRNGPEEQIPYLRLLGFYLRNHKLANELRRGVHASVRVDGTTITARYVSFESLFGKERTRWTTGVRQWLKQWPEIARACDRSSATLDHEDSAKDKIVVSFHNGYSGGYDGIRNPFKWGTRESGMMEVVRRQACTHAKVEEWDLDALSALYGALHPKEDDAVTSFQQRWGIEQTYLNPMTGERLPIEPFKSVGSIHYDLSRLHHRVDFLEYRPSFPTGKEVEVEVSYSHLVDAAFYPEKPASLRAYLSYEYFYQFQYILRTSPKWKDFGPIKIQVAVPCLMAYTLSPMLKWQGEREGQDIYTAQIQGSKAKENLLVALLPETPHRYGLLPGDKYYQPDLSEDWGRYKAKLDGPFADDLLYRMAQTVMNEKTNDADIRWLLRQPEFAQCQNTGNDDSRATLAISILARIPPVYHTRSHDAQLMSELYRLKMHKDADPDLGKLEKNLKTLMENWKKEKDFAFSETQAMDDWLTLCRLHRGELPDAIQPGAGKELRFDWLKRIADLFTQGSIPPPAGRQPPEAAAQRRRFFSLLATLEKDLRLAEIHKTDFTLYYRIALDDSVCLQYADAYARYRDVPEAANLLWFLTKIREDKLKSYHKEFAEELGRRLDAAVIGGSATRPGKP